MGDEVTVENDTNVKPEGADFSVPLPDGHVVWFRDISFGQRLMLQRASQQMSKKLAEIEGGQGDDKEKGRARQQVIFANNKRMWDAIDSAMVFPEDVDIAMDAMVAGEIGLDWAIRALSGGKEPEPDLDDDVEEIKPVAKPSRRANAKRTQLR